MRIQIDAQNWVEVKDVSQLTKADRNAVNEFIVSEYDPTTGRLIMRASVDDRMSEALLKRIFVDWSLTTLPGPSIDPDFLDKLTLEQDEALRAGIQPHIEAIQGKNAPRPENPVPTQGSAS